MGETGLRLTRGSVPSARGAAGLPGVSVPAPRSSLQADSYLDLDRYKRRTLASAAQQGHVALRDRPNT
ncbi:hypothetical protein DVJ77_16760 [Dyella tabacisoli]|uniref:Uncharacterized protein n=1 Tax=Dyella tabacisoli TaxID=2282381 RepID=A0A369ULQ4_9GAMM|nr:hypothetical protein DVJ77_16760 [Dyella tabacisoli]